MIYIDSEFRCHSENTNGEYRGFDVPFFYDKCNAFIEGYMYIPYDETMIDRSGAVYHGEMIAPWKQYDELDGAQREYERQKLTEYEQSLLELGVEL